MKHGLLVANGVLDLVDQKHVRVVVFLQELEVEALVDAALKNRQKLLELCLVFERGGGCGGLCNDGLDKGLAFFLDNVEGDLEGDQVFVRLRRAKKLH